MGGEVNRAQPAFDLRRARDRPRDPVRRRVADREHALDMRLRLDEGLALGPRGRAHPLEHDLRAPALLVRQAQRRGEFEHVHRARIAVELRGERIAEAGAAPQPLDSIGGDGLQVARLHPGIGGRRGLGEGCRRDERGGADEG
jgi:hypothetical protein